MVFAASCCKWASGSASVSGSPSFAGLNARAVKPQCLPKTCFRSGVTIVMRMNTELDAQMELPVVVHSQVEVGLGCDGRLRLDIGVDREDIVCQTCGKVVISTPPNCGKHILWLIAKPGIELTCSKCGTVTTFTEVPVKSGCPKCGERFPLRSMFV
jgi:predicted RNA-binding Zn-ribbon protein involved in translation (DUF1610 family)